MTIGLIVVVFLGASHTSEANSQLNYGHLNSLILENMLQLYPVSIGLLATSISTSDLCCSSECLDALIVTVYLGIIVRW